MKTPKTIELHPRLRPWTPTPLATAAFVASMVCAAAVGQYVYAFADLMAPWPR